MLRRALHAPAWHTWHRSSNTHAAYGAVNVPHKGPFAPHSRTLLPKSISGIAFGLRTYGLFGLYTKKDPRLWDYDKAHVGLLLRFDCEPLWYVPPCINQ